MDPNSIIKQFLSKEENSELRQLINNNQTSSSSWSQPHDMSQKWSQNNSFGQIHNERLGNLNATSSGPAASSSSGYTMDPIKPKHVQLDEIEDDINIDGNQHQSNNLEWTQLPLSQELLKGIQHIGFLRPSKIQQCALPLILGGGRNIIAQAKNGSGKTATFALSMLSKVNVLVGTIQAMCLCPTRELATQNLHVIQQLGKFTQIKIFLGVPQCPRYEERDGYHLYVGTPGKTMEFMKKRIIKFHDTKMMVLDEADELINQANNMGPQVLQIRQQFQQPLQILLFSATFSDEVYEFAKRVAPDAHIIQVKREKLTLDCIEQRYMICSDDEDKFKKLCDIYSSMIIGQSVIFVNSRDTAFRLSQRMRDHGHAVSLLCGSLGQSLGPNAMTPEIRDRIMREFKDGETKVLICTDVLARGIDVPQVTLVINYELPFSYTGGVKGRESLSICMETYLHRIGRTGRFGVHGMAINMITVNEMALVNSIKQFYQCNVEPLECDAESIEAMIRTFRM